MKNITVKKLKNGIRLIHEKREGNDIAAVSLRLRAGSVYGEKPGIAHFLEHLVLDGTKKYPTKEGLENLVVQYGGRGGGATSHEDVVYWSLIPGHALESGLRYVYEVAFSPLLREEDFVKEQKIVFQEAKRHSSQSIQLAQDKAQATLFSQTPLERTIIGTPEEVLKIQYQDTVDFWNTTYLSHTTVLSVVANVSFEDVEKLVENIFSLDEKENTNPPFMFSQTKDIGVSDVSFINDSQADQNRLLVAYHAPYFFDDMKPAANVLATVLGGGKTSRLFKAVRQEKGLAYDTNASAMAGFGYGRFAISSGTTPESLNELISTVQTEVFRMCTEACSDSEMTSAKEKNIFNYYVQNEKAQDRADTLSWIALYAENPEPWLDIESRYAHVSEKEVQAAAKKIFSIPPAVAIVKRPDDVVSIDTSTLVYKG